MHAFLHLLRSLMLITAVSAASHAGSEDMAKESDRAQVGQGSRSIGISFVPAVEMAFERALDEAKAQGRPVLTTEQVLIELLGEETVIELLSSAGVDAEALRADLIQGLASDTAAGSGPGEPRPDEPLQNAMRRAVMKALTSNRKGANGADIVEAILVEDDTDAAEALRKYGLTIQSAENANLERYLERSRELAKRLAEMQEKARSQRQQTSGALSPNGHTSELELRATSDAGGIGESESSRNKTYVLRVANDDDAGDPILFKAALSRNGILDLYVEETPFEIEFVASTIVALFEAAEAGDRLEVQLMTELEGQQRVVSGFSGSAGAIFQDRHSRLGQRSGTLE